MAGHRFLRRLCLLGPDAVRRGVAEWARARVVVIVVVIIIKVVVEEVEEAHRRGQGTGTLAGRRRTRGSPSFASSSR